MKFKDALRNMGQLQSLTTAMIATNVILAGGLVYAVVALTNVHDRVILVPPSLDQKAMIGWNHANKEYLKSFGLYIATLVGNIQPKSSAVVLDSVSAFMDPRIYTSFRSQLMTLIEDPVFKSSGSVISFLPSSIQYETETSRVFVAGTIITSTSGSQKYQKQVIYEIGAQIREGRPWVTHFTSYEGNIPRTVTWWVQKNSRDGQPIPNYALPSKWQSESYKDAPQSTPSDLSVMKPDAVVEPMPIKAEEPAGGDGTATEVKE